MSLLGIDVGGTTVKGQLKDAEGRPLGEWRQATPRADADGRETVQVIVELLAAARKVAPVAAVGVAVPGIVDEASGVCLYAVNLSWQNLPIAQLLRDRIETPLAFGQDVRAGALAEAVSGAAEGYEGTFAFVPIGTGLASAIGTHGRIAPRQEWPGEIGQLVISKGRNAGRRVEEIASASGIARAAGATNAREVAQRVLAGNRTAMAIWNDAVELLGESIASIVTDADATLIVVGGGLAQAGTLLLEPLAKAIRGRLPDVPGVGLKLAAHGDSAAMIGAVELARRLVSAK